MSQAEGVLSPCNKILDLLRSTEGSPLLANFPVSTVQEFSLFVRSIADDITQRQYHANEELVDYLLDGAMHGFTTRMVRTAGTRGAQSFGLTISHFHAAMNDITAVMPMLRYATAGVANTSALGDATRVH